MTTNVLVSMVMGVSAVAILAGQTETGFPINEQAPEGMQATYEAAEKKLGTVPNLLKVMSSSPALTNSYMGVQANLQQYSTLSKDEINLVQLAISVENGCQYCTSGHSMIATMRDKTPEDVLSDVAHKRAMKDPKKNALITFSRVLYESKGRVTEEQLKAFLDAGYTRPQALDVIACIAAKVMSNFTNQLAHTEVDAAFQSFKPKM